MHRLENFLCLYCPAFDVFHVSFLKGILDLHHFKKKYPNYDVDPYIKSATPFFQNFIERSLKMIAEDEKMKLQDIGTLLPKFWTPLIMDLFNYGPHQFWVHVILDLFNFGDVFTQFALYTWALM